MTSNCSHKDWLGLVADAADRGDRTTDCPPSQANHITFLAEEAVLENPSFVEELAKTQSDSSAGTLFNVLAAGFVEALNEYALYGSEIACSGKVFANRRMQHLEAMRLRM